MLLLPLIASLVDPVFIAVPCAVCMVAFGGSLHQALHRLLRRLFRLDR